MSRIGNELIIIPQGVTITLVDNSLDVSGPKGKLKISLPEDIGIDLKSNQLSVKRKADNQETKALHGLVRSLIMNATLGVTTGWTKILQLTGVGYRAQTDGKKLTLMVGYSHPVNFEAPEGISFTVNGSNVTVSGFDKQLVGEITARIRRIKPPEIYKGKGIRYKNEVIHLKPGKAAKTVGVGTGGAK